MWTRMLQWRTLIAAGATLIFAWATSWIMTFKLGWGWSGYDENTSFIASLVTMGMFLVCVISPILAVMNLLERAEREQLALSQASERQAD